MKLLPTALPEVVLIEPVVFSDERGWFMESFHAARLHAAFVEAGHKPPRRFVQDSHSCSRAGVLRGMHHQAAPHAQGKLVHVVRGAAWDVAVDLRRESPTFGRWVGTELSAANRRQLWIPEGFAHGFLALEDETHFLYKTTEVYVREAEQVTAWNDPTLAIEWPLHRLTGPLIVAAKDAAGRPFTEASG